MKEHASFLDSKAGGSKRWGSMVGNLLKKNAPPGISPFDSIDEDNEMSKEQFKELLTKIDSGLRALPATAQVRLGMQVRGQRRVRSGGGRGLGHLSCPHVQEHAMRHMDH